MRPATRPGSRMASKFGERNRHAPRLNGNTPQLGPPVTTRSTVSTPPKGRVDGCPSSCCRVVPCGLCGASSNDDRWSRALVLLLLWVRVLVGHPHTGSTSTLILGSSTECQHRTLRNPPIHITMPTAHAYIPVPRPKREDPNNHAIVKTAKTRLTLTRRWRWSLGPSRAPRQHG